MPVSVGRKAMSLICAIIKARRKSRSPNLSLIVRTLYLSFTASGNHEPVVDQTLVLHEDKPSSKVFNILRQDLIVLGDI